MLVLTVPRTLAFVLALAGAVATFTFFVTFFGGSYDGLVQLRSVRNAQFYQIHLLNLLSIRFGLVNFPHFFSLSTHIDVGMLVKLLVIARTQGL